MLATSPAVAAIFEPVQAPTTFEETVERLGTAIRLGLLPPGTRRAPERGVAGLSAISRSPVRHALTPLTEAGHLRAQPGGEGALFVGPQLALRGPGVSLDGR